MALGAKWSDSRPRVGAEKVSLLPVPLGISCCGQEKCQVCANTLAVRFDGLKADKCPGMGSGGCQMFPPTVPHLVAVCPQLFQEDGLGNPSHSPKSHGWAALPARGCKGQCQGSSCPTTVCTWIGTSWPKVAHGQSPGCDTSRTQGYVSWLQTGSFTH